MGLKVHPETGEEGDWTYIGGMGWINNDAWQGPRTHYEDGTPVDSFLDARRDWNPNWSIRINDINRWAGGQHAGAGRTMFTDDMWNWEAFNDPFWRTPEGRQWVSNAAISNKSLEEIYKEMMNMGEDAEKRRNFVSGSNPLNRQSNESGMLKGYQQERDKWDIDSDVPQSTIDKITKQVDENMQRHEVIGKEGDNRYMFGDADLPDGIPPPPDDGSEYQFLGTMGWIKTGGFTPRDRQLSIETAVRNTHGFDDIEVDAMRVANTGALGWFMGGDQGGYMDIAPHDKDDILRMFGEEGYNPYYGRGWNNSEWRARMTELKGGDDSFLQPWKDRVQGNIMDYLYDKTKGNVGNRWATKHAFDKYMTETGLRQKDLFNTYMTQTRYNQMGLQDILGDFDAQYSGGVTNPFSRGPSTGSNNTGGGFLGSYNETRQALGNPISGDTSGGFLGSYMATRDKLNNRNSIKSLFKEMGDYAE